jgi:two-component system cell cycle sensor histidine kinase/response regulator CckA
LRSDDLSSIEIDRKAKFDRNTREITVTGNNVLGELSGSGRVLIMDDNETVLGTASLMLSKLGYTVFKATDGVEALNIVKEIAAKGEIFDVIILDLTIPGSIGGKEANEKIKMLSPSTRTIIFSGYANDPVLNQFSEYNFDGVLAKPFTVEDIGKVVKDVLSS